MDPSKKIAQIASQFLPDRAVVENALHNNKTVVSSTTASVLAIIAGYPLDSLKSRLQSSQVPISVPKLAATVFREEGLVGFYRGIWVPLFTISGVRAASFTIYTGTKEKLHEKGWFNDARLSHVAISGALGGITSGSLLTCGSTPFELVKVRRQLEYQIAAKKGIAIVKPPNTVQAVKEIVRNSGLVGLYNGFYLHFLRDTAGTALYFLEYDSMRYLLGRDTHGKQGPVPSWFPVHPTLIPFLCGSLAGVSSWALIYPLDVVKTKYQERALAGIPRRSATDTFLRMARGPDPSAPRPMLVGLARIYRGLGISALRSVMTHGALWTLFDWIGGFIDALPRHEGI
ncbi:hypothetical protein BOTBODRAFT_29288 [Botryobasidium botryosum FD-172 SS1]|uniref:Mitochondrial carrier n=1 Tax=Botryobasidium botryosum (strain FD-172 SS1) TaxID=930990 RepID=A0A067N1F1_BOTB1|nr:hypothetical protein BOTBODRAFT_29288 [Botryobasidium botryosum FD-172 SS1]